VKVSDLTPSQLRTRLRQGELILSVEPFATRIRSPIDAVASSIARLYGDFAVLSPHAFADFHVALAPPAGLRRWVRPQVKFFLDGFAPFKPLPFDQAYPMFEWGLNWCIASHAHSFLVIHAAVVERGGRAMVLPAPPGSGKSTLCAGLVSRGWRLLSDELCLLDLQSGLIRPLARPLNLKNRSIDVIRSFQPGAVMTDPVRDTAKGTVALVKPPAESVSRVREAAEPAWIVFPKYVAGAAGVLTPVGKAPTLMRLIEQAFNYDILGARGFEAAAGLVDRCACLEFSYGNLDEAVAIFASLSDRADTA
jgi:HprK-related kinase A